MVNDYRIFMLLFKGAGFFVFFPLGCREVSGLPAVWKATKVGMNHAAPNCYCRACIA